MLWYLWMKLSSHNIVINMFYHIMIVILERFWNFMIYPWFILVLVRQAFQSWTLLAVCFPAKHGCVPRVLNSACLMCIVWLRWQNFTDCLANTVCRLTSVKTHCHLTPGMWTFVSMGLFCKKLYSQFSRQTNWPNFLIRFESFVHL